MVRFIFFLVLFLFPSLSLAQPTVLLPGSPYSTEVIISRGDLPGQTVLILGGVHGNEPAGSKAAEVISSRKIKAGTLIVVPRVNNLALLNNTRTLDIIGDVNRAYPGRVDGTPAEQLAAAIDNLIVTYKVSLFIDLHEGRAFHRLDKTSVGQTVLFAANNQSAALAMDAVDYINKLIDEKHKRFSLLAHPVPFSGAYHAAKVYGIAAFTLETASAQPLEDRVSQHVLLTEYFLTAIGML